MKRAISVELDGAAFVCDERAYVMPIASTDAEIAEARSGPHLSSARQLCGRISVATACRAMPRPIASPTLAELR
jgi:hypothetical protein